MAGRPPLPRGSFGAIATRRLDTGRFRASARARSGDGILHQVTATGRTAALARTALMERITGLLKAPQTPGVLSSAARCGDLAEGWLDELMADTTEAEGAKASAERMLRTLALPTVKNFVIREITRLQESSPLQAAEINAIRMAARTWRTGEGVRGPRPDGQVRDLIDVVLGTSMSISEALALRVCDIDASAVPPTVRVAGVIVRTGGGVARQSYTEADPRARQATLPGFALRSIARRAEEIERDDVEQLLFVTRNGTPLVPHNVRRTIREILHLAGVQRLDLDGIPAPDLHDETPAIWLGQ